MVIEADLMDAIDLIRPALQADGGDIRVVEIHEDSGIVDVELLGACVGCPASTMTLKAGVERILKDRVEGLTEVRAIGLDDMGSVGYDDMPFEDASVADADASFQ
jgi:Fe-S cluster biogenesis protein NfuA